MRKKTLLILAAGLGSRYGGLKQIDGVGPHGEFLIDYAVYDALRAGFNKIVFIIRSDFAPTFKKHFTSQKDKNHLEIIYLNQEMANLPAGFHLHPQRTKPWGTGHAILTARQVIKEPFAVINADDFYGRDSFMALAQALDKLTSHNQYLMVGYQLGQTLSQNGWVARGLCQVDKKNYLTSIYEHTKIGYLNQQIISRDKDNQDHPLAPERLVSMAMFGLTPEFFTYLEQDFILFLQQYGQDLEREFFTPNVINNLLQQKKIKVKVLPTSSQWFGVTYKEDKAQTKKQIAQLIAQGVYPLHLKS